MEAVQVKKLQVKLCSSENTSSTLKHELEKEKQAKISLEDGNGQLQKEVAELKKQLQHQQDLHAQAEQDTKTLTLQLHQMAQDLAEEHGKNSTLSDTITALEKKLTELQVRQTPDCATLLQAEEQDTKKACEKGSNEVEQWKEQAATLQKNMEELVPALMKSDKRVADLEETVDFLQKDRLILIDQVIESQNLVKKLQDAKPKEEKPQRNLALMKSEKMIAHLEETIEAMQKDRLILSNRLKDSENLVKELQKDAKLKEETPQSNPGVIKNDKMITNLEEALIAFHKDRLILVDRLIESENLVKKLQEDAEPQKEKPQRKPRGNRYNNNRQGFSKNQNI